MKMVPVIDLPSYDLLTNQQWWAVIGPGKRVIHLCSDRVSAEQLMIGSATCEVRQLRFTDED